MLIRRKGSTYCVLQNMHDSISEKQRGKAAIDAAHTGIPQEDEDKVSAIISKSYKVDTVEAVDIHTNYHSERIIYALEKRAKQNGMSTVLFQSRLQDLDIVNLAYQVATGRLAEPAAVDIIFRDLYRIESKGRDNDRYVNFYG